MKLSALSTAISTAAASVHVTESLLASSPFSEANRCGRQLFSTTSPDNDIVESPLPFSLSSDDSVSESSSWSVADDWSSLSKTACSSNTDSSIVYDDAYTAEVARNMVQASPQLPPLSEEDIWIRDIVDEIHNSFSTLDESPLYDTSFDEPTVSLEDAIQNGMDDEIAMLIRCNEQPENVLIAEGRALPPLTESEKNNVTQLIEMVSKDDEGATFQATDFLKSAVSNIFRQHATPSVFDGVLSLDRAGIASWMTRCLREEGKVSPHDRRVIKTMSDFSRYGSGRLVDADFQELYLSTIVGDLSNLRSVSIERHLQLRKAFIDAVWRDVRAHGILSPVEEERLMLQNKIRMENQAGTLASTGVPSSNADIVDECEILEWNGGSVPEGNAVLLSDREKSSKRRSSKGLSSHKLLEMARDGNTPLRMRDGEFVFIDEESCIGCMMCANVAPAAFVMLESGRARTFHQRSGPDVDQAVASCPVSCMHPVSYHELKEFETARDEGDGRTDHRHLGHRRGHTPLHVAGIDSDNNHRTSWYHTLKEKCLVSSDCPKRGCYDCPKYSTPGTNPYFVAQHKKAEHTRAQHFIEHGDVDLFRKTADL
ncbi:4Fe-4S single cluster domain of ferredoxin I [Nitzschia inconspicua]|uniref:4Fe-4S single cluster domain of ferredoxin I n=1 Tax=Nitzschia inconspicua TaxID=303405 RepID=A0A9K3KN35_9STRA|nr:4Fe-4S single cluster domain of ferredoxin I [Nitzschia inconspicua]